MKCMNYVNTFIISVGSESDDDTSENSLDFLAIHARSPRPSKYNFHVQLGEWQLTGQHNTVKPL